MDSDDAPFEEARRVVVDEIVPILRRVYGQNARRHDPLIGDDGMTFGTNVYRNSWAQIEERIAEIDGWESSRPEGSLLVTNGRERIHLYKAGGDEFVDMTQFRLDGAQASDTQLQIARSNQLVLDLFPNKPLGQEATVELSEFVVVHAGNSDDGCCAVWFGAPAASQSASPWAWGPQTVWQLNRASAVPVVSSSDRPRHRDLVEPELDVQPVEDDRNLSSES